MNSHRFLLTSEECEVLLEFEQSKTIEKTAQALAKDPSGVCRQFAAISKKYPALEKRKGRWVLSATGKRLNSITRNTIQTQRQLATARATFRIGTNQEFAASVLAPDFANLAKLFPNTQLIISTHADGTEQPLLDGLIDVGIDCERPNDPDIGYKLHVEETIVAVCSPQFKKKYQKQVKNEDLATIPHLLCERLFPDKFFSEQENQIEVAAQFNDIATTRAACIAGIGWSLLPRYSIKKELKSGELLQITNKKQAQSKYGIWWSRTRHTEKENIQKVTTWLLTQKQALK